MDYVAQMQLGYRPQEGRPKTRQINVAKTTTLLRPGKTGPRIQRSLLGQSGNVPVLPVPVPMLVR